MEVHQLEYVVSVAKNRSFTKAALEICVATPTLSQQVKKLEDELGVALFNRTTRSVSLTPAGMDFVPYAQQVLLTLSEAKRTMRGYADAISGQISIGHFPGLSDFGLIPLIRDFETSYPKIDIGLMEGECTEVLAMLDGRQVDAGFLTSFEKLPAPKGPVEALPLVTDELVIVASTSHPLAGRKEIRLEETRDDKYIMQKPTAGLYRDVIDACHSAGFSPSIRYISASTDTRFGLITEGMGIGFVSYKVALAHLQPGMAILRFTPSVPRTLYLVTARGEELTPIVRNFVAFTRHWAQTRRSLKLD